MATNKSNILEGKIAEVLFETGYHFKIEYLPDNKLKWTSLRDLDLGQTETESIKVVQLGDGLLAVNWVEGSGIAVCHCLDLNKGKVEAFMSWRDEKAYGGRATLAHRGTYHFITENRNPDTTPFTNQQIVTDFWNGFFNQHDMSYADKYLAAPYLQHNPEVADGVEAFKAAFIPLFKNEYQNFTAEIIHIASADDLVYLHNHKKVSADDLGSAGMDIFRVKEGKIIEHWDVIQAIPTQATNPHPMF